MKREEWIWMPHPGHFVAAFDCRFHLNTYVGDYIVSTIGEYWPDGKVREITAKCRGIIINGRGDEYDRDYMKKIGWHEIGLGRKYESMVFKAVKGQTNCCPFEQESGHEIDVRSYNEPEDARLGHLELCEKWANYKGEDSYGF